MTTKSPSSYAYIAGANTRPAQPEVHHGEQDTLSDEQHTSIGIPHNAQGDGISNDSTKTGKRTRGKDGADVGARKKPRLSEGIFLTPLSMVFPHKFQFLHQPKLSRNLSKTLYMRQTQYSRTMNN
jgi:hypothetical protein